jgi:hydroxyacylglutathione hydrolase
VIVEQIYLDCLSQASYLVADSGRAVVVDPRRDIGVYLQAAERLGVRIELVVLTHVHADFVPGHVELAAATGADVAMGARAPVDFPHRALADGERIALGAGAVEVLATPGHTPESITLAVYDDQADAAPSALLTGDTLFIGDVGRPDLLGAEGRTPQQMARELYHSLRDRVLPLPDEVLIYPGHGAGSACGKALSSETVSTLGEQRRTNYALADMDVEDFVAAVTDGQGEPPTYFRREVEINRSGREAADPTVPIPALSPVEAVAFAVAGALLLDVRSDQDFAAGHLPGSVNVGLSGRFAEFAAAVQTPGQAIAIVGPADDVREARLRLARVGIDEVTATVADIPPSLARTSSRLSASQVSRALADVPGLQVLDVRAPGEHEQGALPGAVNLPLPRLLETYRQLDPTRPVLVHCAGGYRSSIAASLLAARGFTDVSDLLGGYAAWPAG